MIVKLHKNRAECSLRLGEKQWGLLPQSISEFRPRPLVQKRDTERPMALSDFGARFERAEIAPVCSSSLPPSTVFGFTNAALFP
jgi:hypothetical protein